MCKDSQSVYMSVSVYPCLSVCLLICQSVSPCLSVCVSVSLSPPCLSVCLSVSLSPPLLINKNFIDYVVKFEKHSDRIISCKIKLHGKKSLQIIQVYAATSDHDDETVEMSYKELETAVDKKDWSHHTVMGDFNAKTEVRNINENMKCIGPHGTSNRNEEGKDSWIWLKTA